VLKNNSIRVTLQIALFLVLLCNSCLALPIDKRDHLVASALLTCFFRDHGLTEEQAVITTLFCGLLWEIGHGWDEDSGNDLCYGLAGSLLTIYW
jgi:hypothetical protein